MKSYLIKAWNGQENLWKVFWLYNVLGPLLFALMFSLVQGFGISAENNGHGSNGLAILSGVIAITLIVYLIWALRSLWKCAFNVKSKFWGYICRVWVIWFAFSFIYSTVLSVGNIITRYDAYSSAKQN